MKKHVLDRVGVCVRACVLYFGFVLAAGATDSVVTGNLTVNTNATISNQLFVGTAVGIGNTAPITRLDVSGGDVYFAGAPAGAANFISGPMTGLVWLATNGALRAGGISGSTPWNPVGNFSFAYGFDAYAKGTCSFAGGKSAMAYGLASVALGHSAQAYGYSSIALGPGAYAEGSESAALQSGAAFGRYSLATITGIATGESSIAMGSGSLAYGNYSAVLGGVGSRATADKAVALGGYYNYARGSMSIAGGSQCASDGSRAVALGESTKALGFAAFSMGEQAEAHGDYSVAFGTFYTNTYSTSLAVGNGNIDNLISAVSNSWLNVDLGNVGVGTKTPVEKLDVNGRVRSSTGFNVNGTNGITTNMSVVTSVNFGAGSTTTATLQFQGGILIGVTVP